MIEDNPKKRYTTAFNAAVELLRTLDPQIVAEKAKVKFEEDNRTFCVDSFGRQLSIAIESATICFYGTELEPIIPWQLTALHYLTQASGTELTGEIKPFRELDGGLAYHGVFAGRTTISLARTIDAKKVSKVRLLETLSVFGAQSAKIPGDVAVVVHAFPCVPLHLSLWLGDDELSSSANIYFDSSITKYLPTEDAVVVSELFSLFLRKSLNDSSP